MNKKLFCSAGLTDIVYLHNEQKKEHPYSRGGKVPKHLALLKAKIGNRLGHPEAKGPLKMLIIYIFNY